ncbi:MAG TPA: polymer-forming cytoskeletal protein [Verrucomicrobiae bacterium]|nr:polymer-forming cytoskeletal protein [Verrucomicrobiae bacterium]
MEQATLGATMTVKGELRGAQALYIDGRVEGSIHFPDHRVTVGRTGVVLANIEAKEVVIMGTVTGNIDCTERVDIRGEAVLTGDVIAQRISIDEGALVKGSVEVCNAQERAKKGSKGIVETGKPAETKIEPKAEGPGANVKTEAKEAAKAAVLTSVAPEPPKAAAAAVAKGGISRVAGSSVMFEEPRNEQQK